ncbi:MAG: DNA-processing protein DprA [Oscillospiraceae bacterium]|nr:DNA-processing protein DprA [Oscillospiraceae bacterium]
MITDFNATAGWLWLVMVMGIANRRTIELARKFPSIRELYYAMQDPDNGFLKQKEYQKVKEVSLHTANQIVASCKEKDMGILTWESADYPKYLKNICDPPAVLFYKGSPEILLREDILTIVGTRQPTNYSVRVGEWLCYELAMQDILIASGGAVGMDSVAHCAAIRAGKPTIAVMGCGLDCDYPKGNRELREKILQTGVLITEYFPGTPAYGRNFPIRNRILAGISKGTLVLEAAEKSGAMITANNACEQNRTVFCIPPADIFENRYSGQAALLRDGATPVFGLEDVLPVQGYQIYSIPENSPEDTQKVAESGLIPTELEKFSDCPEDSGSVNWMLQDATPEQQKILELLREGNKNINLLCQLTGLRFDTISTNLLEMELLGWIVNRGMDDYHLAENLT